MDSKNESVKPKDKYKYDKRKEAPEEEPFDR